MAFNISKFHKLALASTALALVSACGGSNSPTGNPNSFAANSPEKPVIAATQAGQTKSGATPSNAMTNATLDADADSITIARNGTTDLTATGSTLAHPNNSKVKLYAVGGADNSDILVAQTSNGDGYAVAYRNDAPLVDPEASVLTGGARSTSGLNTAITNAQFNGDYLGVVSEQAVLGTIPPTVVTGDVILRIDSNGTGFAAGSVINNRQAGSQLLNDINIAIAPGGIDGNLEFSNIAISSTSQLGVVQAGRMDGAFFEADASNNPDGEVVGTIILNGSGTCPLNDATVGQCTLETGVFQAD